ncbi:hypothetical protein BCR37DRAFT_394195 [Protomyces lactucae-debilis]|uniref:RBR-type E3 ubiquitin transferase n=1 Tax=Protomyces lactucae-debilis TaxID=2754530 RepID=A0A1Y2F9A1_PROLT|nr:uncharacterized protein BCR37DRAFT_394195 [Protomyces lactucae-debilis]ORY79475.1 hypothetical protein BCR37DRAFT_394195 [Protomyces lactucae-debilis]
MLDARRWHQAYTPSSPQRNTRTTPSAHRYGEHNNNASTAGDRIDDYRIDKKLGQGATGQVFKAHGLRGPLKNKVIAIKIIKKTLLSSAKRKQRVADEIAVHRELPPHPAIVRFEHSFEDLEHIYICTEYCSGSTVFAYLQENYPTGLSEAQAGPLFLSLVQAVSFMHLNEIMHRDLKLSNVLLTDTLQVKIADFGLATKLRDATADQDMTMCGTPNYISPEIVNRAPYGIASDVWSLGCILVALLTGKPPFQGDQISETLQLVAKGAYRPLPRGVSRDVKSLVDAILQIDPERRLTTAEMMAHPFLAAAAQRDMGISPLSPSFALESYTSRGANILPVNLGVPYHTPGRKSQLVDVLNRERPKLSDLLGKIQRQGYSHLVNQQRAPSLELREEANWPLAAPRQGDSHPSMQDDRFAHERETTYEDPHGFTKHQQMVPQPDLQPPRRPLSSHRRAHSAADAEMEPRERYWPREQEAMTQDAYRRVGRRTRFGHAEEDQEDRRRVVRKSRSFSGLQPLHDAYKTGEGWVSDQRRTSTERPSKLNRFSASPVKQSALPLRTRFGLQPLQNVVEEIIKEDEARESAEEKKYAKRSNENTEDPSLALITKYRFQTTGLKPASQSSKHGNLAILEDGSVTVELAKGGQQYSISSDGTRITLTTDGKLQTFNLADLPARHLLAYRFASKFVNLVRSKTIRIAINAADARSRLYENDSFEVVLVAEGRKVAFDPATQVVKVADREAVLFKGPVDAVDVGVRESVRTAMMWYNRCYEALGAECVTPHALSSMSLPTRAQSRVEKKFVEGTGWCERYKENGGWVFYLLEGTIVRLDTTTKMCYLEDTQTGQTEEHVLEAGLPRHLRFCIVTHLIVVMVASHTHQATAAHPYTFPVLPVRSLTAVMSDLGDSEMSDLSDEGSFNDFEMDSELESDDGFGMEVVDEKSKRKDYEVEYKSLSTEALHTAQRAQAAQVTSLTEQSEEHALILLRHFKWKQEQLLDRFMDDSEAVLKAAGVPSATSAPQIEKLKEFECPICCDDGELVTYSLECGHRFCLDCYTRYLEEKIVEEGEVRRLVCPGEKCKLVLLESSIRLLTESDVFSRYQRLLDRVYVDDHENIRWCPAPECECAIECNVPSRQLALRIPSVECAEGHLFCFGCGLDEHQPCICPIVKIWLKKCEDDSETSNWISANTKECPKCTTTTEKNGGCNHMTCRKCKYEYCWVCMGTWADHGSSWYNCGRFQEKDGAAARDTQAKSRASLERYLHYYNRFANHEQSAKLDRELYVRTERKMSQLQKTSDMSWIEVQFLKTAVDTLTVCRRTLKWTYAFAFYLKRTNATELFEDNQKDLELAVEQLSELCERPIIQEEVAKLRHQVLDKTVYVGARREVFLTDTARGLAEGRWAFTVDVKPPGGR